MKKISILLFALFIIISCVNNNNDNKVMEVLNAMHMESVNLNLDGMMCRYGAKDTVIDNGTALLKMVLYVDSSECSPCMLDRMYLWNDIIEETEKYNDRIRFIFIFEPKHGKFALEDVLLAAESSGLNNCIYVDTAMLFKKQNPNLPGDKLYHAFLIDERDNILLVGNPVVNKKVKELFDRTVKSTMFNF